MIDPAHRRLSLKHRIASLSVAEIVSLGLAAVQTVATARMLGATQLGQAVAIIALPNLILALADPQTGIAILRFGLSGPDRRMRLGALATLALVTDMCVVVIVVGITTVLVVVNLLPGSARGYDSLVILYTASFLASSLSTTSRVTIICVKSTYSAAGVQSISAVLRFASLIAIVGTYGTATSFVIGLVVGNFIDGSLNLFALGWLTRRGLIEPSTPRRAWRSLGQDGRRIARYVVWNDLGSFMASGLKQLDTVILTYVVTPTAVGAYQLGKNLGNVTRAVQNPVEATLLPILAAHRGSPKKFWNAGDRVILKLNVPLGALSTLLAPLFVWLVLPAVVGHTYNDHLLTITLIFMNSTLWVGFLWVRSFYLALDMERRYAIEQAGGGILGALVLPIAAHLGGALGVAGSRTAMDLLLNLTRANTLLKLRRNSRLAERLQVDERRLERQLRGRTDGRRS